MIWHQNMRSIVHSDVLQTSKQHLLFSNSIPTGLRGSVESNGLTYAMPLPPIIWCGVNDVLLGFSTSDIIPMHPGNTLMLFVAIKGIEICCINSCLDHNFAMLIVGLMMFNLTQYRMGIPNRILMF